MDRTLTIRCWWFTRAETDVCPLGNVAFRCLAALLMLLVSLPATADDSATQSAPTQSESSEPDVPADNDADTSETPDADANDDKLSAETVPVDPPAIDDLPWEVRPYRVLVSVAYADRKRMDSSFIDRTTRSLERLTAGAYGSYWQTSFELNNWLFPQRCSAIDALTAPQLTTRFEPTEFDKVLVLILESEGPTYRLCGCEWDRMTQSRGPSRSRDIVDRRRIASVTFEMLTQLLRPIARIDLAEGTFAELRVRGGELVGPHSPLFPFRSGDLLTGHFRYLDRDRNVRKIQDVPWTYLRINQIDRSRMTANIETAFSNPFSGSLRRVELIAQKVEPVYPGTELSLSPRTNPGKPLVGVRVRVYSELPRDDAPPPERIDLMTDRQGTVTVPAFPDKPMRRLIVHSGGAVLSNVPFVPGVESRIAMQLPDDSPRLQVEGSLAMVQGDLIDVVSRRVVMLARAISQARKEEFDEADALLKEVDAQPSIASFESRILAIRVPAVDQARANRDRSQEKRILMMCRELEELVNKFLDRKKVEDAKAEISELKKIAE